MPSALPAYYYSTWLQIPPSTYVEQSSPNQVEIDPYCCLLRWCRPEKKESKRQKYCIIMNSGMHGVCVLLWILGRFIHLKPSSLQQRTVCLSIVSGVPLRTSEFHFSWRLFLFYAPNRSTWISGEISITFQQPTAQYSLVGCNRISRDVGRK